MRLKIYKSFLSLSTLTVILISCNSNVQKKIDDKEVYSLIINKSIHPLPPPPPPSKIGDTTIIKKETLDSIFKIELNLAVDKNKLKVSGSFPKIENQKEFIELVKQLYFNINDNNSFIDTTLIVKEHKLTFFDSIEKNKIREKYDAIIHLSSIIYNKKHNKAVVIIGINFDRLSGSEILYFLEKKDNLWHIVKSKTISIA